MQPETSACVDRNCSLVELQGGGREGKGRAEPGAPSLRHLHHAAGQTLFGELRCNCARAPFASRSRVRSTRSVYPPSKKGMIARQCGKTPALITELRSVIHEASIAPKPKNNPTCLLVCWFVRLFFFFCLRNTPSSRRAEATAGQSDLGFSTPCALRSQKWGMSVDVFTVQRAVV